MSLMSLIVKNRCVEGVEVCELQAPAHLHYIQTNNIRRENVVEIRKTTCILLSKYTENGKLPLHFVKKRYKRAIFLRNVFFHNIKIVNLQSKLGCLLTMREIWLIFTGNIHFSRS